MALLLEVLDVTLPLGLDVFGAISGLDHLPDIVHADEFLEERGEETVADVQVAVGFDEITQVESLPADGRFVERRQVAASCGGFLAPGRLSGVKL